VGEAWVTLGAVALARVEVVADRADEAVLLPRQALECAPQQRVGLACAVRVGREDGANALVGADQREVAVVVERLSEAHEAAAAPGADRGVRGVEGHRRELYAAVLVRAHDAFGPRPSRQS